jgi:hypothetical protein
LKGNGPGSKPGWAALAAVLLLSSAAAAAAPVVESTGPLTDKAVPAAVRSALEPKGTRLTLPEGPWCELWLRKSVPDRKNGASGALHGELFLSTAVGVIHFLAPAADFRGQAVGPGFYTLRYAVMPTDGSHMGVSEYPDFLLVVPAAEDPDLDAVFKFDDLMASSRKATGTKHPGVFALVRPSGAAFPAATTNDSGYVILQVKAKLRSGGEAPIALVVKGHAEQ